MGTNTNYNTTTVIVRDTFKNTFRQWQKTLNTFTQTLCKVSVKF